MLSLGEEVSVEAGAGGIQGPGSIPNLAVMTCDLGQALEAPPAEGADQFQKMSRLLSLVSYSFCKANMILSFDPFQGSS